MSDIASIFVSDLHIGRDNHLGYQKIDELIDFIDRKEPDYLGLIGDIGDPWEKSWKVIIEHPTWKKLQGLVDKRSDQKKNLKTVWIHENHDSSAEQKHLQRVELVRDKDVMLEANTLENPGVYPIILRHGHQWCVFWGGIQARVPYLPDLLFWIQDNHPRLARWLNRLYRSPWKLLKLIRMKPRTPSTKKPGENSSPKEKEKWGLSIRWMHNHARSWAIKKEAILIFGHTHYPDFQMDLTGKTGVINTGDWLDSFSLVVYEKGKLHPELCKLEKGELARFI